MQYGAEKEITVHEDGTKETNKKVYVNGRVVHNFKVKETPTLINAKSDDIRAMTELFLKVMDEYRGFGTYGFVFDASDVDPVSRKVKRVTVTTVMKENIDSRTA